MRISLQRTAMTVAATAVAIAAFAAPAQASTVSPNSGSLCSTGTSNGNTRTCMSVTGSGLKISSMTASAQVVAGRTIEVCLRGPNGPLKCSGFVQLADGGSVSVTAVPTNPNANQTPGDYCANTYRQNANLSQTQIGHVCVNVHA